MLALNVPYEEKDQAKTLGAKWNPKEKLWMAPGSSFLEYSKFSRWIDGSFILHDEIYIVETSRQCWKCGKETPIICFASKNHIESETGKRIHTWKLTSVFSRMPSELLALVKTRYNFKLKYSNTVGEKYYANCCSSCDSLQGNNFLFNEVHESPLYVNSPERAKKLIFHKCQLPFDLSVDVISEFPITVGYGSVDDLEMTRLIDTYSTFIEDIVF